MCSFCMTAMYTIYVLRMHVTCVYVCIACPQDYDGDVEQQDNGEEQGEQHDEQPSKGEKSRGLSVAAMLLQEC